MVEEVKYNNVLLSIIIRHGFSKNGIEFFTPGSFSQQLGYMNRPKGHLIEPHLHNTVKRIIDQTQEVLFLRKGKVRVDFFTPEGEYFKSKVLFAGDVILLASGGHGFEMLEQSEIIEVKQGPYCGDNDKIRF